MISVSHFSRQQVWKSVANCTIDFNQNTSKQKNKSAKYNKLQTFQSCFRWPRFYTFWQIILAFWESLKTGGSVLSIYILTVVADCQVFEKLIKQYRFHNITVSKMFWIFQTRFIWNNLVYWNRLYKTCIFIQRNRYCFWFTGEQNGNMYRALLQFEIIQG